MTNFDLTSFLQGNQGLEREMGRLAITIPGRNEAFGT